MDAQIKKIQVVPSKLDEHGEIKKPEFATITLEIPMDSTIQKKEIVGLFETLRSEYVSVVIEPFQKPLPLDE